MQHEILTEIDNVDIILIGLGEEFDAVRTFRNDEGYLKGKNTLQDEKRLDLLPAWQRLYRNEAGESVKKTLDILSGIMEGRNYYVVSVSTNADIADISWRDGRLVMPCGTDMRLRCDDSCKGNMHLLDKYEMEKLQVELKEWRERLSHGESGLIKMKVCCPVCGKSLVLNNIYNSDYDENEYLPLWNNYIKWLQGTLNRKVLVLELGVGMRFPTVIRFPFEKIVYFNNNAKMYRVNENLYQLPEELSTKGLGIAKNAIDWLQNLC